MVNRSYMLIVRITKEEGEKIKVNALKNNMSVSEYVRSKIIKDVYTTFINK
jgi:predicted HicB family RNase H-like nuclease